jgi:hypothetical protein
MITLNELVPDANAFEMYHGGARWVGGPEIQLPTKNHYEGGIGIYFTTSYLTARKYAKGGKVVTLAKIKKDYTDIEKVKVEVPELLKFVTNCPRLRKKAEIKADILRYSERTGRAEISLGILMNLIVNYEAGSGHAGMDVVRYMVSKGVDAIRYPQPMEDWLIVLNPSIIVSHNVVQPSKLSTDRFNLPRI